MKKLLLLFFLMFPVLVFPQDKEYSYTFLDIIATHNNDIGYVGDVYLGLPASIYIKGSVRNEDAKTKNTIYDKSRQIVSIGYHSSIADIFKNVSKSGYSFNFARIMDVYAELGVNKWELINPEQTMKTGSDIYAQAGIRAGNPDGWEFNFFLESTKMADVELDPVTQKINYSFDGELNNNFGFKFIKNATSSMGYSIALSHDDFSGFTPSVGVRIGL